MKTTATVRDTGTTIFDTGRLISRRRFLGGVLAFLLSLPVLAGCGPQRDRTQRPVHVVVAYDYSQSCHDQLPQAVQQTYTLPGRLNPGTDWLTVLRLAYTSEELLDQPMPESEDKLRDLLIARLKDLPSVSGTRSALLWQDVGTRLSGETRPTAFAFYSDGDDDEASPASIQAITEAARRLAANPNIVSVSIMGVRPANKATLRAEFASLGERFHLYDVQVETLEPVLDGLDRARQGALH